MTDPILGAAAQQQWGQLSGESGLEIHRLCSQIYSFSVQRVKTKKCLATRYAFICFGQCVNFVNVLCFRKTLSLSSVVLQ